MEIGAQDYRLMGTFKYLQVRNKFPLYNNTESTYYYSGDAMFKDMLTELKKDTIETIKASKEISLEDTKKGVLGRVFDAFLRLVAPLT